MGSNYIFSLTPTFTQGLVFGQLSILILLSFILKYLFLESGPGPSPLPSSSTTSFEKYRSSTGTKFAVGDANLDGERNGTESADWFNLIIRQVVETYRSKLRNDHRGPKGDEIARRRIEQFANSIRPANFADPIHVISVDLGSSAPEILNAKVHDREAGPDDVEKAEFDMTYTDTLSVSLSTSILLHYPIPYFIRMPVTLTVALSLFSSSVTLTPPNPLSQNPTITISLLPDFTLNLKTTSLVGSRAKLADVPKLHEIIQSQVRRILAERGTWEIAMPWVTNVDDVKDELMKEEVGGEDE